MEEAIRVMRHGKNIISVTHLDGSLRQDKQYVAAPRLMENRQVKTMETGTKNSKVIENSLRHHETALDFKDVTSDAFILPGLILQDCNTCTYPNLRDRLH